MSINFDDPMNNESREMLHQLFGEPAAEDERNFLVDISTPIRQSEMKAVANAAGQPATVIMHGEGEEKTMSDGTVYIVTPKGWRKK